MIATLIATYEKAMKSASNTVLKVMIVDDHEVFRKGLLNLVNRIDTFRVVAEASSIHDALTIIETKPVDLILLDLSLPDSSGIESVHLLKNGHTPPDIIIISASMDDDILLEAVMEGVSGYITKDTPAVDIIKALQSYQPQELAMVPSVMSKVIQMLLQQCKALEHELSSSVQAGSKTYEEHSLTAVGNIPQSSVHSSNIPQQILTPQEEKVFQLMRKGYSNKQIAADLFISRFTVGKHVQNILRKLGVTNRTQAVSHTSFEGDGEQ